ncbi:leucine-rich repeat neuronal protein 3 [Eurytemora carolleeae]|uniref:leucine-rich repeat neuronal protein 3 n=1 Tax=Eurytemora carolleeae TaxID=1294199 RepID=UPI000C791771|nr:leucine-rich repeat neuronal protein 3 [Eurytemora carolleeae]|eukprot:XP_023334954.1 leucine-rich repeat neuronal protein 3-like [Eurytemora affinis]
MSSMPTLEDIDALAFHDLHSLETLDCRDNENLKHFHPQAFKDNLFQDVSLMELRYLYISGNSLSTISQQLVDWSKLSELLIGGNALECDCELAWLSTGVNSTWINDVTCSGPQELAGKLVLNAASDMKCDQTLGIEVLTVLAVIVMGFTLFIILGYIFARRQWPHHVPKINLFGESAVPQYFPLS